MGKIRIGVIGLGIGRHHIQGYRTHPAAEVVAIADLDEVRLGEIGVQYGVDKRLVMEILDAIYQSAEEG
jgi:predicted dehydrogenase